MSAMFKRLLANTRFYILLFALLLSGLIWQWATGAFPDSGLRAIRMEQIYGFLSIALVYLAILATPLYKVIPTFPGKEAYAHARRAIGVSAFYFAALHISITFFGQLKGFAGISFLGGTYAVSLLLGLVGAFILFLMAATSLDYAIEKMTFPRWKMLHRFVYMAGLAILAHVVLVGSHFSSLSDAIPRILAAAVLLLCVLEAIRFDMFARVRWAGRPAVSIAVITLVSALFGYLLSYTLAGPSGSNAGPNVHAQHLQIAQDIQNQSTANTGTSNTSLSGDRTKRYTVSFEHGDVQPGQPAQLNFRLYDASNGSTDFNLLPIYTRLAHLVIVDESLDSFQHIHPQPSTRLTDLAVNATFPHPGNYRLYLNYQPSGAIEQQVGFSMTVGDSASNTGSTQPIDATLSKSFDGYTVKLQQADFSARKFTLGQQKLNFSLYKGSEPVTNLYPYLGAYGHLVMVRQGTYDYIHIHPASLQALSSNSRGGPDVAFLPLGLYGSIEPGTYRVFAEFNPDNKLITADFTIRINP